MMTLRPLVCNAELGLNWDLYGDREEPAALVQRLRD